MIVVYGSINIDLIGHAPSLMRPGETVLGSTLEFAPGGKGANQALAAARAGAGVKMVGCIGEDEFAGRALALLREAEIDLSFVRRMDRHTGVAMIVVDDAGENMITVLPGANSRLSATALDQAGITAEDTLLLQLETPLEGVAAAAARARAAGAMVVLNLAPYRDFPRDLLKDVSVLVVNEGEMAGLLEKLDAPEMAPEKAVAWLSETLDLTVVATLGGKGAIACEAGDIVKVPALKITPVDTVGAGDTFVGYLAAGLAEGRALKSALELAATAAGLACLKPGAQPAIPERDLVDEKLAG
ncbi:ribokinase [Pelagibacterium xiamenense]|uniref:ribokinase n=1 Tax=Pelagibacterium xiamenense TaxID=2901140 RepID=UPI001E5F76EC|nr:ribokinase [Pelagibacterium xiamenense]MCD7058720.1 ribokinase [Pelagibacterium xiamenense]